MALRPLLLPPGLAATPAGAIGPAVLDPAPADGLPALDTPMLDAASGQSWTVAQIAEGLGAVFALVPGGLDGQAP